jgi:hypothetical protein
MGKEDSPDFGYPTPDSIGSIAIEDQSSFYLFLDWNASF